MVAMIVQLENTGNIEWFVIVLDGETSIPVLGRQQAAGRLGFLTDRKIVRAFLEAKCDTEIAIRIGADERIALQDLEAFFDAETWLQLEYNLSNLDWDDGREVNVTGRFHSEDDPQVYLLDEATDAYLLCPSAEANLMIVRIGKEAVVEALTQSWNGDTPAGRTGL